MNAVQSRDSEKRWFGRRKRTGRVVRSEFVNPDARLRALVMDMDEMHNPRVTGRPQINRSFFEGKMNTFWGLTSRDFYAGYKRIQGMPNTFYLEGQYLRTSSYSAVASRHSRF